MTEQNCTISTKQATLSLPGNAVLRHQRSFNSDTKPAIPVRPFIRSNTISGAPSTSGNSSTVKVIENKKNNINSLSKPPSVGPTEKASTLKHAPPKPLVEPHQISKSLSEADLKPEERNGIQNADKNHTHQTVPLRKESQTSLELAQPPPPCSPTSELPNPPPCSPPTSELPKPHFCSPPTSELPKPPTSRPPPPNMKPPARPTRPFPPPPQARLMEARLMEAKLAKKKPPPPSPITVIDTRSSVSPPTVNEVDCNHGDQNGSNTEQRDLKEMKAECSSFSNIPKRPPPPAVASTRRPSTEIVVDKKNSENGHAPLPKGNIGKKQMQVRSKTFEEEDDEEQEGVDVLRSLPASLDSSPKGGKLVNKMKSSFRNLTQRRKNRGPGSPSTRKSSYGKPHYDEERYPEKLPVGIVSPLVLQCIGYLNRCDCLHEPGLFRIPGDMSVMKRYRGCFARGEEVDLNECNDPHTIAGLLKLHFREPRICIIPGDALVHKITLAVESKDVDEFRSLIQSVDVQSQAGIRMLAELLKKVTESSAVNHMTSGTLATSCGPSFFPRIPPSSANAVLKFMTDNCDAIFGD